MATYNELLKNASPDQYGKLEKLMSYTANERYGGAPQDWQAQIFTPIDVSDVPKQIDVSTASKQGYETKWDVDEYNNYSANSYVKKVKDANGLAITAKYSPDGALIGFEAPQGMRNWLSGNQSVSGAWDASGNPKPIEYRSGGGGFLGGAIKDIGEGIGDFGNLLDRTVRDTVPGGWTTAALLAAGAYNNPELFAAEGGAAGTAEGAGAAGTTGGLMGGAGGITAGSSGVGLTGAGTSAYGGLGAGLGEATAAGGVGGSAIGGLGLTAGTGAAYGGLGAGLGTSAAAMGTGSLLGTGAAAGGLGTTAAATGAGLGMSDLATAGLIQGGLGLAGGLLQGNTTQKALEADAAARAKLAAEVRDMGKFQPVGTTTRFGTSSFVTDPVTGAITPSYSLSPEALAYQNSLSALGTQGLQGAQTMMKLGQQYVGESPEAVRQRYIATQNALLAPQQEQALAGIRTNLMNTGRGGLSFGATSDGLAATNPELAAYYNSLATQQRQLAAAAETQYQNQVNFGTGLMGGATTPFTNVFGAQRSVEAAAQQPLELSTNFANTVATRGAAQGANYATAMSPSLQSSYNAANYNPYATALQGASSNPLVGYGLLKAWS